ncbi:fibronectin type III domain-containing protein [Natronobiforma cellulositropha]|uniref:fibronectin type III domain-containing protein n=1 Tax=Natronobiforma cellulositropha TaxID=1679076 RepID=UPI0021D56F03|nr:fibronectin type III domain-containing protein [Natronobiforma cellulositropha]
MTQESDPTRTNRPTPLSRRRFLQTSLLAGAGTVLSSGAAAASTDAAELFHADFESVETGAYEPSRLEWGGNDLSVVSEEFLSVEREESGNQILVGRFPEGVEGAGNGNGGGDFIVDLGAAYDELYCAYRIRFDEGFEFHQPGGKLPGLAGTDGESRSITGGDVPDGENGWSARMMWRDPPNPDDGGLVMFYTYHPDMPDEYGDNLYWDHGPSGQVHFQPGEWHLIEHRVVMNTPGENDGILEGWFDGEKAYENHGMRFRDTADLGIDDFYFSLFFGGGQTDHWAHDREEQIAFDDVVVSSEPIWLDDDEPPAAPETLESVDVGSTSVDLAWSASEDAGGSGLAGYCLYANGRLREEVSATTTEATLERLVAGTEHELAVSAVDHAGNESATATVTVETEPLESTTPPSRPAGLTVTDHQLEWLDLAWDPAESEVGLAHYEVSVDGTLEHRLEPETTATRVSGLSPDTAYDLAVSAVDLAGTTGDQATLRTGTAPVRADEDALVVHRFGAGRWPGENALGEWAGSGNFLSDDELTDALRLEYDDSGWVRSYVDRDVSAYDYLTLVARGDRGGEESHLVVELDGEGGRLVDLTDDAVGTTPSAVRIPLSNLGEPSLADNLYMSFTEGGAGALEFLEIRFETAFDPAVPDGPNLPANLAVTETTTESVTLAWDEPAGSFSHYAVYVDGRYRTWSEDEPTATVDGLEADTEYEFAVRTIGANDEESSPATLTVRTESDEEDALEIHADGVTYTPADLTGDGLYEDVTGDGTLGFNDVVVFFDNLDDPVIVDNPARFDFSGTGDVGFADVIALFELV